MRTDTPDRQARRRPGTHASDADGTPAGSDGGWKGGIARARHRCRRVFRATSSSSSTTTVAMMDFPQCPHSPFRLPGASSRETRPLRALVIKDTVDTGSACLLLLLLLLLHARARLVPSVSGRRGKKKAMGPWLGWLAGWLRTSRGILHARARAHTASFVVFREALQMKPMS